MPIHRTAGRRTIWTRNPRKNKRDDAGSGKQNHVGPITPATAPDAPIIGMTEPGAETMWAAAASVPQNP